MGTSLSETCREVEINMLRSSVHLVGFILKRLYRDERSKNIKKHITSSLFLKRGQPKKYKFYRRSKKVAQFYI